MAMSFFLGQDGEILPPEADLVAVLKCHRFRDLVKVAEIVNDPRREQLPEGDPTERRVGPTAFQCLGRQFQRPQVGEVLLAEQGGELQQLPLVFPRTWRTGQTV